MYICEVEKDNIHVSVRVVYMYICEVEKDNIQVSVRVVYVHCTVECC